MNRRNKVGGLIALQRKRKKERMKLAHGQRTEGSFGAEHTHERIFAAGKDNLNFLDIDKVEQRLHELSGLILSYVSAVGNLKMPMWHLQCIRRPEQWDRCPLVRVLRDLLEVQPGYTIENTILSLPHGESDNPSLITAIIVFLWEECVFQNDSSFETTSAEKGFQGLVRSEETLEQMLREFRLELPTEKASSFGTYEVVTAPIRGTFDSHLHKADTPLRTEQNPKGPLIFLTTMIGVKCRRPGGDWKKRVHAQVRSWPSVVPSKVKPNLIEERQSERRKTEGATNTRPVSQTLERDPTPPQTKRRSPSPSSWIDLNPDWSKGWRSSIIYPRNGENRARVDKQDVGRLREGEFLNDNLIVFYLRWLRCQLEQRNAGISKRIFFHNSFFYSKLTVPKKGVRGLNYAAVKRWTKDDLLHYDYIIVPVNEQMHWYVAIICNAPKLLLGAEVQGQSRLQHDIEAPGHDKMKTNALSRSTPPESSQTKRMSLPVPRKYDPEKFRIITFDSFGGQHSSTCTNLKDYLVLEARAKLGIDIPRPGAIGTTAKGIPLQDNYYDCGVFLLNYVETFLKDPDDFITRTLQNRFSVDMKWPKAPETRVRIRDILFSLQREQSFEMPHSSNVVEVVEVVKTQQALDSQLQRGDRKQKQATALSHLSSPDPDPGNKKPPLPKSAGQDAVDLISRSPEMADESERPIGVFFFPRAAACQEMEADRFLSTHWRDYVALGSQDGFDEFSLNYPGDKRTVDLVVDLLKLRELGMEHGFHYFFQFVPDLSDYLGPPQRRMADIYLLRQVLMALAHHSESVDAYNFVSTMLRIRHDIFSGHGNRDLVQELKELKEDSEVLCEAPKESMVWFPHNEIGVNKLHRHPRHPLKLVSWSSEREVVLLLYGYTLAGAMGDWSYSTGRLKPRSE